MNKELKEKWLEALESGKYLQGRRHLRAFSALNQQTAYCCLGVLCDIMGAAWTDVNGEVSTCQFGNTRGTMLSIEGLDEIGVDDATQRKLAHLNDDGFSFQYISDYIRKNL